MKLYANWFAYACQDETVVTSTCLLARDRPVLVLEAGETLAELPSYLIPLGQGVYEIGFPYLQPDALKRERQYEACLTVLRDRTSYTVDLHITDEVLDAETCTSKSQEEELKTEFGWR
ncbi:MAG: hypothetical protein WBB28_00015, partial [Crinalium sp.]